VWIGAWVFLVMLFSFSPLPHRVSFSFLRFICCAFIVRYGKDSQFESQFPPFFRRSPLLSLAVFFLCSLSNTRQCGSGMASLWSPPPGIFSAFLVIPLKALFCPVVYCHVVLCHPPRRFFRMIFGALSGAIPAFFPKCCALTLIRECFFSS